MNPPSRAATLAAGVGTPLFPRAQGKARAKTGNQVKKPEPLSEAASRFAALRARIRAKEATAMAEAAACTDAGSAADPCLRDSRMFHAPGEEVREGPTLSSGVLGATATSSISSRDWPLRPPAG